MTFLIDGYNLLHALGLASRQMPAGALERARLRMLDWLAAASGDKPDDVHVVFDAQKRQRQDADTLIHAGVQVRFAVGQCADDLIEELIAAEVNPRRLTVISNDHRLQDAARRRGCIAWSCGEYIDHLLDRGNKRLIPLPDEPSKPGEPGGDEIEEWLRRFGS